MQSKRVDAFIAGSFFYLTSDHAFVAVISAE